MTLKLKFFRSNESHQSEDEILSCPQGFILFNKYCYYVHSSFIYNIRSGERLCYNQHMNSTLVKYDTHEWGNINATRFLGRTFSDILIEFFYYILETKLQSESIDDLNRKNWLRLLFGDKNDPNECVLRYFTRSSGAFTIFYRCNNGGHPVCQCDPIRTKIPKVIPKNESLSNINNSITETKIEQTPITITTSVQNFTEMLTSLNITHVPSHETNEDLINHTNTTTTVASSVSHNKALVGTTRETQKSKLSKYQPIIVILAGPVLAFVILFFGVGYLIHYVRQGGHLYTPSSSVTGTQRTKRSSTIVTTSDMGGSPKVTLYSHLKPSEAPFADGNIYAPVDTSMPFDDNFELLPSTHVQTINDENKVRDEDEQLLYTKLQ